MVISTKSRIVIYVTNIVEIQTISQLILYIYHLTHEGGGGRGKRNKGRSFLMNRWYKRITETGYGVNSVCRNVQGYNLSVSFVANHNGNNTFVTADWALWKADPSLRSLPSSFPTELWHIKSIALIDFVTYDRTRIGSIRRRVSY